MQLENTIQYYVGYWVNKKANLAKQSDKLEFIKNPVIAEFLGFASNTDFTESDFEKSILSNLQKFLMESAVVEVKLTSQIEKMIKNQFGLDIPVFVISKEKLEDILHRAPDWRGDESKEIYDNLIFIMPPAIFKDVYSEIGEPIKKQTGGLRQQVQILAQI